MAIRDIVISALLFASLPACLFRPFFGVLMWTIIGLLNPQAFMWRTALDLPWAMVVAILTLIGFAFLPKNWVRLISRETGLIIILWCWFTFTTIHNTAMAEFTAFAQDTWLRWEFVSKILLMTLVTMAMVNTKKRFRLFVLIICACIGTLAAKALPFMVMTGGQYRLYGPPGSMLADNNDLGLVFNMTLPLYFFMARNDPNPAVRKIMWFLFAVTIPAIFFTYSRGALVGLAVILIYMVMRLPQRLYIIPVLIIASFFAVFFTPERWQERMDFRRQGALIDQSAESRFNSWIYSWRLAKDYPLTGAGFEAYTPELFARYAPNAADVHGPHSIYFQVLAEHGFIGFFLYVCLLVSVFSTLRKTRKFGIRIGDKQTQEYALMIQIGLIGFLVTGAFLGRAYFDYYFTFVAVAVMLKHICQEQKLALASRTAADSVEVNQQEQPWLEGPVESPSQ
jgi:probable O-glycosylation ligase (exosortase A-associated)